MDTVNRSELEKQIIDKVITIPFDVWKKGSKANSYLTTYIDGLQIALYKDANTFPLLNNVIDYYNYRLVVWLVGSLEGNITIYDSKDNKLLEHLHSCIDIKFCESKLEKERNVLNEIYKKIIF